MTYHLPICELELEMKWLGFVSSEFDVGSIL